MNAARLPSRVKRLLWVLLVVALLIAAGILLWHVIHFRNFNAYRELVGTPGPYSPGSAFTALKDETGAVPGFELVAQNERMALYLKESTAEVAVYDKQNGTTVYSNPQDADHDPVAKATNLENLKSQFILSYLDGNAKEGTAWSSYGKSVANGQVSYETIENGVRVIYSLTNEKLMLVPDQLTPEWYAVFAESGRKSL